MIFLYLYQNTLTKQQKSEIKEKSFIGSATGARFTNLLSKIFKDFCNFGHYNLETFKAKRSFMADVLKN